MNTKIIYFSRTAAAVILSLTMLAFYAIIFI